MNEVHKSFGSNVAIAEAHVALASNLCAALTIEMKREVVLVFSLQHSRVIYREKAIHVPGHGKVDVIEYGLKGKQDFPYQNALQLAFLLALSQARPENRKAGQNLSERANTIMPDVQSTFDSIGVLLKKVGGKWTINKAMLESNRAFRDAIQAVATAMVSVSNIDPDTHLAITANVQAVDEEVEQAKATKTNQKAKKGTKKTVSVDTNNPAKSSENIANAYTKMKLRTLVRNLMRRVLMRDPEGYLALMDEFRKDVEKANVAVKKTVPVSDTVPAESK